MNDNVKMFAICLIVVAFSLIAIAVATRPSDKPTGSVAVGRLSVEEFKEVFQMGADAGYERACLDIMGELQKDTGSPEDNYDDELYGEEGDDYIEPNEETEEDNSWEEMYPERDSQRQSTEM